MYSDSLGRFVSRDPMGYVDGMSMYGGYFVPNASDYLGTYTVFPNESIFRFYSNSRFHNIIKVYLLIKLRSAWATLLNDCDGQQFPKLHTHKFESIMKTQIRKNSVDFYNSFTGSFEIGEHEDPGYFPGFGPLGEFLQIPYKQNTTVPSMARIGSMSESEFSRETANFDMKDIWVAHEAFHTEKVLRDTNDGDHITTDYFDFGSSDTITGFKSSEYYREFVKSTDCIMAAKRAKGALDKLPGKFKGKYTWNSDTFVATIKAAFPGADDLLLRSIIGFD